MSCAEPKCQQNYEQKKALRKCLREEVENNKKYVERIKELEIDSQSKGEQLEAARLNNSRLVSRIETLQAKEKEKATQPAAAGGGWGGGFFSGSNALQQELEKVKNDLDVAQEELEAKMTENCK